MVKNNIENSLLSNSRGSAESSKISSLHGTNGVSNNKSHDHRLPDSRNTTFGRNRLIKKSSSNSINRNSGSTSKLSNGNFRKHSKSYFGKSLTASSGLSSFSDQSSMLDKSINNGGNEFSDSKNTVDQVAKTGGKILANVAGKVGTFIISNPITIIIGVIALIIMSLVFFILLLSQNGSEYSSNANSAYTCASTTTTPFNLASTSLDKTTFIEKVNAYTPARGETQNDNKRIDAAYEVFKDNAGLIYDMALERGYNPEFVIIRADTEGFSPGYDSYNYWGIGCQNGHPEKCVRKDDFASGLSRFFDVFDTYKKPKEEGGYGIDVSNIYEVMNLYADLGGKWFSPGNSSLGGCYYLKFIQPYLTNERYQEVKNSCDNGTEIPVTAEDELAYAKYQVETATMPKRQKIFGLGEDAAKVCSLKEVNVNPIITPDSAGILSSVNTNAGSFLRSNGSSVSAFNNTLLETVKKDGIGSRQAVVDAAMLLVNTFATYNMKIPYSYYGGWNHYDGGNPNDHNFNVRSYYGLNPYFGETIMIGGRMGYYNSNYNKTYYYLGLDCSGFVTWSLHNGGVIHRLDRAKCYKVSPNDRSGNYAECGSDGGTVKAYPASSTTYIGQPGDVLSSDSHVMLVLKYNKDNNSYIFAEAGGKDKGILIREKKLSSLDNYSIVDMSNYYTEAFTNKNYEVDFQEKRLDKNIADSVAR